MWPHAVQKVNKKWRRLNRDGTRVGLITNAKETLRRELRAKGKESATADYCESDSPSIAKFILDDGLIHDRKANSESFDRFMSKVQGFYPAPAAANE